MQPSNQAIIANRYLLTQKLGEGGLGQVFNAQDQLGRFSQPLAIKVVHPELLQDPTTLEQINREVQALAAVTHPNILPILDYRLTDREAYLVYPLAEGGSLKDIIGEKRTPVPYYNILTWLESIAFALDTLHQYGFIHRDIKPANILLDGNKRPMLADFSLALPVGYQFSNRLHTAEAWGTAEYAAPEIWEDRTGKASDIYALGVVLYELFTGHQPYQGNLEAVKFGQMYDPPPPFAKYQPTLNLPNQVQIEQIIAGAMSKDPLSRPPSAISLFLQLRYVINNPNLVPRSMHSPTGNASLSVLADKTRDELPRNMTFYNQAEIAKAAEMLGLAEGLHKFDFTFPNTKMSVFTDKAAEMFKALHYATAYPPPPEPIDPEFLGAIRRQLQPGENIFWYSQTLSAGLTGMTFRLSSAILGMMGVFLILLFGLFFLLSNFFYVIIWVLFLLGLILIGAVRGQNKAKQRGETTAKRPKNFKTATVYVVTDMRVFIYEHYPTESAESYPPVNQIIPRGYDALTITNAISGTTYRGSPTICYGDLILRNAGAELVLKKINNVGGVALLVARTFSL
jgi:serine/threonine protein kinase